MSPDDKNDWSLVQTIAKPDPQEIQPSFNKVIFSPNDKYLAALSHQDVSIHLYEKTTRGLLSKQFQWNENEIPDWWQEYIKNQ